MSVPLKLLRAKELDTADNELLLDESMEVLDALLDEGATMSTEELTTLDMLWLDDENELDATESAADEKWEDCELAANDCELAVSDESALDKAVLDKAVLDSATLEGEEDKLGVGLGDVVEPPPPPPQAVNINKTLVHTTRLIEKNAVVTGAKKSPCHLHV